MKAEYIITSTNGTTWANNYIIVNTDDMTVDTIEKIQNYLFEIHGQKMIVVNAIRLDDKTKMKTNESSLAYNEMVRLYHGALQVVKHYAKNNFSSSSVALDFLREIGMGGGDMI
jgi:hypothetical protein